MSEICDMIQRLCPDGVEYKKLISVAKVQYGYPFDAKLFTDDDTYIPLIRIRDVKSGKSSTYYSGAIMSEYIIHNGDILVGMDGEFNLGRWKDRASLLNQRVCKIASLDSDIVLNGFLFHLLLPLFKKIEESITGSTVKHLSAKVINDIEIPVPPLEVQRKIVEILDNFSELTADLIAKLTAELEARRKQYEYFRDSLLNFSQITPPYPLQWMKMSEICKSICSGGTPNTSIKEYYDGNIPWLRTQEVDWNEIYDTQIKISELAIKQSSAKIIPVHCVIVAMYGATAAKACINRIPLATNQACCNLMINSAIAHYKYVYYYINSQYENIKSMGEGSQSNISSKKIKNLLIPIPPLSEQERIVAILDRFEALTTDLTSGLPAEIKARQQQYEYYRDQLLTFKRAN